MKRVLILAGGTGGHVIPALALADEFSRRGVEISWIGTQRGVESSLVPKANIELDIIQIEGICHKPLINKLFMPLMMLKAMKQCFVILKKRKPSLVLGMGGFVSGPGGLVSSILNIPLVLHEQNAVAGLTNEWLAKFSPYILTGFPIVEGLKAFKWVGNPLRQEILNIPSPEQRMCNRKGPLRILVLGGSQGSLIFNNHLAHLLSSCPNLQCVVRHQCGIGNKSAVQGTYINNQIDCHVDEFIDDMSSAYAWSDVVICRAGAMTLSELCAVGTAGILVPYPYAAGNHQIKNANYLVSHNAAMTTIQEDFIAGKWLNLLAQFNQSRDSVLDLAYSARRLAKISATVEVVDLCLEIMDA